MYSEPKASSILPIEPKRESEPSWRVPYDESRDAPAIGKGQNAESLPRTSLCLDTGTPPPPPENMRHPESQAEIDAIYRETIGRGVIDHHSIDAAVDMPADKRRCTTTMVADFPSDVLAMMRERGTTHLTSHHESDLDSTCATYLAKSLLVHGKLPSISQNLSTFVNRIDYGRYQENDPDKFLHSLQGAFSAIKHVLLTKQYAETGKIWQDQNATRDEKIKLSSLVRDKYQNQMMASMFELLNAAEEQNRQQPGSVDFTNLDATRLKLTPGLNALLTEGGQGVKEDFKKFEKVFERAEQSKISVIDKQGNPRTVQLIIIDSSQEPELSPLGVTNLAYNRVPPDAIIAVYAGPNRKKGGDNYDIGMKPESTEIFDLKFLEQAFNEAEAEKRMPIIQELTTKVAEGTATAEEQARLAKWQTLRPGFEHIGHGDPTVSVAGNSLIAASTTSLLDFESFRAALEKARQQNQPQG